MTSGDKLIGYVRVSTIDQGNNGVGLEAQRATIEAECLRKRWELLRIEQDVASGKSLHERPGLERTIATIEAGEAAGIIVAKLDRLSRSVIDFANLLRKAQAEGWNIVALDFGLDLSTPQGKLVANVLMSVAEWERDIIGQRTREALAVKRQQGVRLGRPTSIAPELAERIRRMRSEGMTLSAIARTLNEEEVPTPRGGSEWRPSTLQKVLR